MKTVREDAAGPARATGPGVTPPQLEWLWAPGARARAPFTWNRLLWALVFPQRRQRVAPTVSGGLLIVLSLGIGAAAYNAANNILFITLALLLACLIASGVLSWVNFRGLAWRLELEPPLRSGGRATVLLRVRNGKRFLPTYGLWFELGARALDEARPARAETTFTARAAEIQAALAQAAAGYLTGTVPLSGRLDPGATTTIEWTFAPGRRGRWRVELRAVGSLFPFGFLRKEFTTTLGRDAVVWPAPVDYHSNSVAAARRTAGGRRAPRSGSGEDLFALRRYDLGDSHRLIHWKASARTRQLLVRQYSADAAEGFALWLRVDDGGYADAAQYELLIAFAASLAEALFRSSHLTHVALNERAPLPVRRLPELESWLDAVAVLPPWAAPAAPVRPGASAAPRWRNLITFRADGPRGVAAVVDGEIIASA